MGRSEAVRFACKLLLPAIVLGALAFRVPQLRRRPMHNDEANQACKSGRLQEAFDYRYDPKEHHGPTLYYLSLPFAWLASGRDFAGTTERTFRIVPVLFGTGLILLLYLVRDGLGGPAALGAALLAAVSPAMVFYSRFYIQEMLLVFFTFGGIAAGWRYVRTGKLGWALLGGAFLGLMYATKETCVIAYAGMYVGFVAAAYWSRRYARTEDSPSCAFNGRHLAGAVAVCCAVSFLFFSSFFTNLRGPLDSVRAYFVYLVRAGGDSAHIHPWHYYLKLLAYVKWGRGPAWSEAFIIALAVAGLVAVVTRRGLGRANPAFMRFIAVYTLFLTFAYSIIPYKTPWCMLSFLHGMTLLAGVGAVAVVNVLKKLPLKIVAHRMILLAGVGAVPIANAFRKLPLKVVACLLFLPGVCHLGRQAHRASYNRRYYADQRLNPYVYAHTGVDLLRLVKRVDEIAEVHPQGRHMLIRVIASPHDTWPLPWYLRRFENVGYWHQAPGPPAPADAPMIIVSPEMEEATLQRLRDEYQTEYFGLRPSVLLKVYIAKDLWDAFLRTRAQ